MKIYKAITILFKLAIVILFNSVSELNNNNL